MRNAYKVVPIKDWRNTLNTNVELNVNLYVICATDSTNVKIIF